jgi:hypothetical protein
MQRVGLLSRYAFDNWVTFCFSCGYIKPVVCSLALSVPLTGNSVVYEIYRDVVLADLSDCSGGEESSVPVEVVEFSPVVGVSKVPLFGDLANGLHERELRVTRIPDGSCRVNSWARYG